MLNSAQNQLLILEKRGSEPCGKYESPTLFDFAEREYLRRSAKDTNKSSAKPNLFSFAEREYLRQSAKDTKNSRDYGKK